MTSDKKGGIYIACGDSNKQNGVQYFGGIMNFVVSVPITGYGPGSGNFFLGEANESIFKVAFFTMTTSGSITNLIVGNEYRWYVW